MNGSFVSSNNVIDYLPNSNLLNEVTIFGENLHA